MNMPSFTRLLPLFRPLVSLFAACSGLTGYLLAPGREAPVGAVVFGGTLLLAAGSSALNQYQEREIDGRMERTRLRPLPQGAIASREAMVLALLFMTAGLVLLLLAGRIPVLLGALAAVWYNGVYTPLKRFTAFAAVPGAVVGMIPPAMGWAAAGGSLVDPRLGALSFLFFLWQVPHFWLQVLHHGRQYEQAGLPSLCSLVGNDRIGRIVFTWIFAAAVAGMLLPLYGTVPPRTLSLLLLPAGLLVVLRSLPLLAAGSPDRSLAAFRSINLYILIIMTLLSAQGLMLPLP